MVIEMIMESVFAVVDIFFVSKLGTDAIATVGITESLITLIYAIAFGLCTGTAAMISRRIGEKNNEQAANIAFQAILLGLIASLCIAIPGVIFASKLLQLMGASGSIFDSLSGYTDIMLGGNITIM